MSQFKCRYIVLSVALCIFLTGCIFVVRTKEPGCTEPNAVNYDSSANLDEWILYLFTCGILCKCESIRLRFNRIYPGNGSWIVTGHTRSILS